VQTNFQQALTELPAAVANFFSACRDHTEYDCAALKIQLTVHFRGTKVGGLNRLSSEWYFSRVFIDEYQGEAKMAASGFKKKLKKPDHVYWGKTGAGSAAAFKTAMEGLTGVPL